MTDHPTTAQLHQFLQGSTATGDPWPGLHAERCPPCAAKLRRLLDDVAADVPAVPTGGPAPPGIPGYEIAGELGRGGAGVVYKARQVALDRPVALKVLLAGAHASADERQRFAAEADALAKLRHPNLVTVYDAGVHDGVPFLAMELVEGATLRERLAAGPLDPAEAAAVVHALALALAAAHAAGIVHRDLKPGNILLQHDRTTKHTKDTKEEEWDEEDSSPFRVVRVFRGSPLLPKVTDFGLARRLDATAHTATGALLGSPGYMAPEQVRGEPAGKAADVWGLGVILYECLTGRPPFIGAVPERLSQTVEVDPPAPAMVRRSVPRDLDVICMTCLRKEPGRRYADAGELAADLGRWLRGAPIKARPVGAIERGWKWARRRPGVVGLLALLAVAVAAGVSTSLVLWRQEADARREVEEQVGMLRRLLATNVGLYNTLEHGTVRLDPMLDETEASLERLLERRPGDLYLREQFTYLLLSLGKAPGKPVAPEYFEKAARLWDDVPLDAQADRRLRKLRATIHGEIAWAHACQGKDDHGLSAAERTYHLWKELAAERPDPHCQDNTFESGYRLGLALIRSGCAVEEVVGRFDDVRAAPRLVGGVPPAELLVDILRAEHAAFTAGKLFQATRMAEALAAARRAAAIHGRRYLDTSLDRTNLLRLARHTPSIASMLKRCGTPREALAMIDQMMRAVGGLSREARDAPEQAELLSLGWFLTGKFTWAIEKSEAALGPYREALAQQRLACVLAPAVEEYRVALSWRHLQLGRKLCELGRLDEAEGCFREQRALWPGDADRGGLGLRELRKWAGQAGDGTPAARLDRDRYLDLAARLEK